MKRLALFSCALIAFAPAVARADVGQSASTVLAAVRSRPALSGKGIVETHAHEDQAQSTTSVLWMWHHDAGDEGTSYSVTIDHNASTEESYTRQTATPGYSIMPGGKGDLAAATSKVAFADYSGAKQVAAFASNQMSSALAFFRGKKYGYETTHDTTVKQSVKVWSWIEFPLSEMQTRIAAAKACVYKGDCGD